MSKNHFAIEVFQYKIRYGDGNAAERSGCRLASRGGIKEGPVPALGRVFGFEIMPAPFVVAHLQVGLTKTLGGGL